MSASRTWLTSLLLVSTAIAVSSCSDSSSSSPQAPGTLGDASQGSGPAPVIRTINLKELEKSEILLRTPLDFASGTARRYKEMEGTRWETEVIRYSIFFHRGERISAEEAATQRSFCEFYADTSASSRLTPEELMVAPGTPLRYVQTAQTNQVLNHNGDNGQLLRFDVSLSAGFGHQITLGCQNVADTREMLEQIGDALELRLREEPRPDGDRDRDRERPHAHGPVRDHDGERDQVRGFDRDGDRGHDFLR